jgi:hypothetical protein
MGHSRIGTLPQTRPWRKVVGLITQGADVGAVAAATARAAESTLASAAHDPALRHSFWLLTQILIAAKSDNFVDALRRAGLYVGHSPTLPEICAAFMEATDRQVQSAGRTDLGELAQISAVESLSAVASKEMPGLFGPTHDPDDSRDALRGLATPTQFAVLARDFFARLTRRYLEYFISRELPKHIRVGARFPSLADHRDFEEAIDVHCRQTALIVRDFSAQWFSKHTFKGGIDPRTAGAFVHHSFTKITSELARRH